MICDMIIKAIRFRTKSNVKRLISHLIDGDDNDVVAFVSGTGADINDMHLDALAKRSTYSIRHWIVAPHEATTRAQMREVVAMIAQEFNFDAERAVIVEHKKKRSTANAYNAHWHILVGEIDPVSGRVLKCSFDRIVHELVARWSEFRFGHKFVQGKHTKSVIAGLRKRGAVEAASRIEDELSGKEFPSAEAFTHSQHQATKRAGIDLPAVRQAVKSAFAVATTRAKLEAMLAASSLLVTVGDKRATWIVTDADGNLIGSLSRLAGQKKSEINKIMEEASDEPANSKADNRTSNPDRSTSNSQSAGADKRPPSARSRNPYPDTGQNPGKPRTGPDSNRAAQSENRIPEARNRDAISWSRRFDGYRDQLSALLGKSNYLAMSADERIVASLWEIEERARADLNRKIPVLADSEKVERLRVEAADLDKSVAKKRDQLFDAELRLRKAKRPKWWHYLLGIAFVFERKQQHVALAAQQAFNELEACKRGLEAVKSKLFREEFQEKQRHAILVQDVAKRKRAAGPTLDQVEAANDIIRLHPALALCGIRFVLVRARARIDEVKGIKASLDRDLGNDGFRYKR